MTDDLFDPDRVPFPPPGSSQEQYATWAVTEYNRRMLENPPKWWTPEDRARFLAGNDPSQAFIATLAKIKREPGQEG